MSVSALDQLAVATIRTLSIDGVEKANSGHPGLPMGAAPMAYVLWTRFLRHNPANPSWANRDRFVLSAGHGSMLLYSLLHLMGYGLTIEDLEQFRQWGSKTPGHPEYRHTIGVETTTGPLGQGLANAVGMAMAERFMAAHFNQPDFPVIDHYTYALVGDGDLMEGISYEATSLAGHLQLERLIVLYDSNDISLDGPTKKSFTDHIRGRFEAAQWRYLRVENGNDIEEITNAITRAKETTGQPTLIEVRTTIGYGSPGRQGTSAAHGMALGSEEVRLAKQTYGWKYEGEFVVPEEVRTLFATFKEEGGASERQWQQRFKEYSAAHPTLAKQLEQSLHGELPANWDADLPVYPQGSAELATRQASGQALNALAQRIPTLLGGSADLAGSNETTLKDLPVFTPENYAGRNIWFGVREHAMGGILNGMALYGGLHVYGGTFMVFSDYMRPSIRLASLMRIPVIYVFTHDSIGVGEDGPTHQPVEQLAALRVIPNLVTIRPADANETAAAWRFAIAHRDRPVALALTRQKLPILPTTDTAALAGVERGGYIVDREDGDTADVLLLASGSEVSLAMQAKAKLVEKGWSVRVVSLPSFRLFDEQPIEYRESILPPQVKVRVGIEMAHPFGWDHYLGDAGQLVAIDHFGASAPLPVLLKEFGFTVEAVLQAVTRSQERSNRP